MASRNTVCRDIESVQAILADTPYEITEFIGEGGMACVYLAKERGSPIQYAFKFIKQHYLANTKLMRIFREEAENMGKLAHPNIVRFYRFVEGEGYAYIVMEYIPGHPLSAFIRHARKRKTSLPTDEVMRIAVQVARAIDNIHRETFIHRDIKPGNILLHKDTGQAYLADLGITTAQTEGERGVIAGTAAYMPCEQQQNRELNKTADIYAFAVVVYEMLTGGQRPYTVRSRGLTETSVKIRDAHCYDPPEPISTYRPDLPASVTTIFNRALAKEPDERYQKVQEFVTDLHRALLPYLSPDLHVYENIGAMSMSEVLASTDDKNSDSSSTAAGAPRTRGILTFLVLLIVIGLGLIGWQVFSSISPVATPTLAAAVPSITVTEIPPTAVPTTIAPTTDTPTLPAATQQPTTQAPTEIPPTAVPTTIAPTTDAPALPAATQQPTTQAPTEIPPTAIAQAQPETSPTDVLPTAIQTIASSPTPILPTEIPPSVPAPATDTLQPTVIPPSPTAIAPTDASSPSVPPPVDMPTDMATVIPTTEPPTETAIPPTATATVTFTATPTATATFTATPTATATFTATPTATATFTATPTATATFTATPTATATATPSPVPTAFLAAEPVFGGYLDVALDDAERLIGIEGELMDVMRTVIDETGGAVPLRQPPANGFRVELELSSLVDVVRFGVVFRVIDLDTYLRFTVDPRTRTWQVEQIMPDADPVRLDGGGLDDANIDITQIAVSGLDTYYRFEVGDLSASGVILQSELTPPTDTGYVGLYIEMANPNVNVPVDTFRTGFVGDEAVTYSTNLPEVAEPLFRFENRVLTLVEALQATDDQFGNIQCRDYMSIYDELLTYLDNPDTETIIRNIQDAGSDLIYDTCAFEEPFTTDGVVNFESDFDVYSNWQFALPPIIETLGE